MDTSPDSSDGMRHALKKAADRAGAGPAAIIEVACAAQGTEHQRLREAHAHFCSECKLYIPLCIRGGTVRFALTDERIRAVHAYMSKKPHELFAQHRETIGDILTAAGAAALGAPSEEQGITAVPVLSIDVRYGEMENAAAIGRLVEARPGLAAAACEAVVLERMQAAHSSLLEYLTLVPEQKATGLGIAMVAASFEIGSRLGMPILVAAPEAWQRRFGLSQHTVGRIRTAFSYLALSTLLPELLPGTGYEHHEAVLSSLERHRTAMRGGTLGSTLPQHVIDACSLTPHEISEKGVALYPYTVWD